MGRDDNFDFLRQAFTTGVRMVLARRMVCSRISALMTPGAKLPAIAVRGDSRSWSPAK